MARSPRKQQSQITQERIERAIQLRYSPFPELTVELIAQQLSQFRVGTLRPAARTWEIMFERDGELCGPAQKRYADTARLPWEIEKADDSRDAEKHADALRYYYNNLTATSAMEQDHRGGVNLLVQQIMSMHAFRYTIHEQVLQIDSIDRKQVTATLIHCPVWFFENRTGRLRFLASEGDYDGTPMERGQWVRGVGHGHMCPCSVAYTMKQYAQRDHLLFSARFGVPGIQGKTDAAKGSKEWNDFAEALRVYASDWITVTNRSAEISLIETSKAASALPFVEIIDQANRLYARLFRGGDLSTQSGEGDRTGASLQDEEKTALLEADVSLVNGILNTEIDEPLIAYLFGGVRPLAWFRLRVPRKPDSDRETKGMEFLVRHGGRVSLATAHDRLQIPEADDDEEVLSAPAQPAPLPTPGFPPASALGNAADRESIEALITAALAELPSVQDRWLAPLREWYQATLTAVASPLLRDDEVLHLVELRLAQLPELLKQLDASAVVNSLEAAMGSAVVSGIAEGIGDKAISTLANSRQLALANAGAIQIIGTPTPLADAVAQMGSKTPIGSILRTREWERMPLALRQRAQFSAGVESVRMMQAIQDAMQQAITSARGQAVGSERIAAGQPGAFKMNRQKFIADMQEIARREGLTPVDEAKRGTLQDITSEPRLELIYRTQIGQAQGYSQWKQGQDPDILDAWPAQELVRNRFSRVPRDWPDRFEKAALAAGDTRALEVFKRTGRMVALKTSGIWTALSRFGTPYPPFDFNSGMGLKLIDREDAIALGLLAPDQQQASQVGDFNDGLSASVTGLDDRYKASIGRLFGDQIDITGDTIQWRAAA